MFGISRCVDNFVRLRRLSSAGYFPPLPPPKKLVQGVKKTNKQKSKQLILARHPTCMVRASYMAMAICFQRGMVNNVGIYFIFQPFCFYFSLQCQCLFDFFSFSFTWDAFGTHCSPVSQMCRWLFDFFRWRMGLFFYFLSCFHYLGVSFYSKECCIAISFTSLIGLCVD
jgi:hypothetical protein